MKYILIMLSIFTVFFSSQTFAQEEISDPCSVEKGLLAEWISYKYLVGTAGHKAYKSSSEATKTCLTKNVDHDYYCGKVKDPDNCRENMLRDLENYNFNAVSGSR
ncbi:hypothetical protein K2P97_08325 [bacterium]|nr:hypothetical protein [bacterium]